MKTVILLAVVAVVAIMAIEAEDATNLLSREERSAAGGKRPLGPSIRRKKRKQGKNAAKNSKGKKKAKNGKTIDGRTGLKSKSKTASRQTCSDEGIANQLQKIGSWRAAIKNTKNLYNNLVDKVSVNGTIKESLRKYIHDAKSLIGSFTKDGSDCLDDCPADACAAFQTLSNCNSTILTACQIPETVTSAKLSEADEEDCFAQLDAFEQTCTSSNRTNCCGLDFTNDQISKCKYTDIVKDIRTASKSCLDAKTEGTLSYCMLKVKQTPLLVKNCTPDGVPPPPVNCTLNSTCSDKCYKDFGLCIDKCILTDGNCLYPTPYFNETSQTCSCRPEDAKRGDYAKCDEDGCECVPQCQKNEECPGGDEICNADNDNCGYCGLVGDGDGCCTGCFDDSQCAFPTPNCKTIFSNTTRMNRLSTKQANNCTNTKCCCINDNDCGAGYECDNDGTTCPKCVLKDVKPGVPSVNQVQFCSVQCANCTQESVNLEFTGQGTIPPRTCDTPISGNNTGDFDKISPLFTNQSISGCFMEPLNSIGSAKVTWTGTGSWTPNKICVDWIPDTTAVAICTFNQTALSNGESASSTSCVSSLTENKCNFDIITCP